ncbi:hypothetical protein [Maribacter sp. 2210JD10-5]|uniref:hypothetical protein n=1 Tax=Maribacter sp. 2210JD10-5 TaxID=3386272 RepID=UPI0039BD3CC1
MNKLIHIVILLFTITTIAQSKHSREKIKSLKIAFITERLNLTTEEAQAFWPIYNAHEEKKHEFRRKERTEIHDKIRESALTEKEANALVERLLTLENEKHEERIQFYKKINKAIPSKKAIALLKVEEEFKRRLLKRVREGPK